MRHSPLTGGAAAVALICGAVPAQAATGAPVPALVGPWLNTNAFKLLPAPSGPKPVGDLAGHVQRMTHVDATGRTVNTNAFVGNYRDPLLTPWAAAILKHEAEDAIKGTDPFWPATDCYPFGPTALLQPEPVMLLQGPQEVTIFYERDHQVRHVYLSVPHSGTVKPSWYGESVGHYEGDVLVVDTIGFNDKTFVDRYGVPFSNALHMIERYRAIDGGQKMQVEVTYEDPKAFTQQWKAMINYVRVSAMPQEVACAESAVNPVTGETFPVPVARRPDF
jgi:hypothetical protein